MNKHLYDTIATNWLRPTGNSVWIFSDPHFGDFDSMRFRHLIKVPDKKDYFSRFKDGDIFETYETFISKEIAKANEELIKKINSKLNKNDTIIFLGDIGDVECIKKIKGYKVLIMGNHDKGASNYKAKYVTTTIDDGNGHILHSSTWNENKLFDDGIKKLLNLLGFKVFKNNNTYKLIDLCNFKNKIDCNTKEDVFSQLQPYIMDYIIYPLQNDTEETYDNYVDWCNWYKGENCKKYPNNKDDIIYCDLLANHIKDINL